MTQDQANALADEWIAAWNAHDLDRILSHYSDDISYTSPFAVSLLNDPSGAMYGKPAVREYFHRALTAFPDLVFQLNHAYAGVNSLVIHYQSVSDLIAAEYFEMGSDGRFCRVTCHYHPK